MKVRRKSLRRKAMGSAAWSLVALGLMKLPSRWGRMAAALSASL